MEQAPISELSLLESNPTPRATPSLGGASDASLEGSSQYVHVTLHAWGFETSLTLGTSKPQFPYLHLENCACHSILPFNFVSQRERSCLQDVKQCHKEKPTVCKIKPSAPSSRPSGSAAQRPSFREEVLPLIPPSKGKIKGPLSHRNYSDHSRSFALRKG